jgi:hypothetical protein
LRLRWLSTASVYIHRKFRPERSGRKEDVLGCYGNLEHTIFNAERADAASNSSATGYPDLQSLKTGFRRWIC